MKAREKRVVRAISKEFAKILDKIKTERIKLGKDNINNRKPDWRLTLAISRHPAFQTIVSDLIIEELKNE